MDIKGPCMGQLFILPAGLSTKPLSAPSKLTTQSRTRPEYPPPTDPCIHLFLQTPPAHCWIALWQLWTCREVSFTGWGGVTSDYMRLGFFLELHQGKPKEPSKTFGLGNPAPGGRSMPQADGKTSFQSAGAKASSQNSSDTQQTSNNPEWTLCPDWLCVPITLCVPPPRLTLPSSAVLSTAARRCCCPQLIQGII